MLLQSWENHLSFQKKLTSTIFLTLSRLGPLSNPDKLQIKGRVIQYTDCKNQDIYMLFVEKKEKNINKTTMTFTTSTNTRCYVIEDWPKQLINSLAALMG